MQDRVEVILAEIRKLVAERETKPKRVVQYPAPFLTIAHSYGTWTLSDRSSKENLSLGRDIEFLTTQAYYQSKVFSPSGVLKMVSQIVLPNEKENMLNVLTGELWKDVVVEEGDTVVNSWLIPVVIVSKDEPIKAIWEVKKASMRTLINFMRESDLRNLNTLHIKATIIVKRDGDVKWGEPKIAHYQPLKEVRDEKLLLTVLELLKTFEEFRKAYNMQAIQNDEQFDL